jgi:hypothetical protein
MALVQNPRMDGPTWKTHGGICEQRRVLVLFGKHMGVFVNKVEY